MENYLPSSKMLPLRNIIKSHLVIFQHSNKKLCSSIIESLSTEITETIESFLNKDLKENDSIFRNIKNW